MRKIFALMFAVFSFNSFAADTTYVQCYGVKDSFAPRSDLIKKSWGVNDSNQYLKLKGYWRDNSYNAMDENYFVVKSINSVAVNSDQMHEVLTEACRKTLARKYSSDFLSNISYFATSHSYGYEYPAISEAEAFAINNATLPLSYNKMLRYAFASSYVYSTEPGANAFAFSDDAVFQALMLADGSDQLEVVDSFVGDSGVYGVAIKVPAIPAKNLEEEVIISFKGTSNGQDFLQDVELMFANLNETDEDWQRDAYNFTQRVLANYPANTQSLSRGYQASSASQTYNIVLTGHSLGGYTAIDAGVRTGILTRTFSSPATRIIEKYIHLFSNKMRYRNAINLVRKGDPVSTMSGRHNENMIYFPGATGSKDPARSHYLTPFINEILKPLAVQANDAQAKPTALYITADTTAGSGLDETINYWDRN